MSQTVNLVDLFSRAIIKSFAREKFSSRSLQWRKANYSQIKA